MLKVLTNEIYLLALQNTNIMHHTASHHVGMTPLMCSFHHNKSPSPIAHCLYPKWGPGVHPRRHHQCSGQHIRDEAHGKLSPYLYLKCYKQLT
jgi:hypothetical protein